MEYEKMSMVSSVPAKHSTGSQGRVWEDTWIPTYCSLCGGPDLIKVRRVNGVVVDIAPNELPDFKELRPSRCKMCAKPFGLIQKLYNPYRVKGPLKRTNPQKGIGIDPKWVEISWEEALDTVAERLRRIRAEDARRLWLIRGGPHRHGSSGTWEIFQQVCAGSPLIHSGNAIRCNMAHHVQCNMIHSAWGGIAGTPNTYCNYRIILGSNHRPGNQAENVELTEAQARGMKLVVIDPMLSETANKADEWIIIKPGTDLALLLALIDVVLNEIGVIDTDFLKNLTNSPYLVGPDGYFVRDKRTNKVLVWDPVEEKAKTYDDNTIQDFALDGVYSVEGVECRPALRVLKEHVSQYTPEWASSITEIPAGTIRRLGKEWVDNARIGSTINIEGVSLPYRPVIIRPGRGAIATTNGYQVVLCEHILQALVGALETVGGHGGGTVNRRGGGIGIVPGPDGMLDLYAHSWTWPPINLDMNETLFPYQKTLHHNHRFAHVAFMFLANPPKNAPLSGLEPELAIKFRSNPVMSIGDPEVVAKALCKIPLLVSIAYTFDETTQLADIVMPDHTEFERYELLTAGRLTTPRPGIVLKQPVVEPLHNTKEVSDIFTELADRAGFLDEYNTAVNDGLRLTEVYKLEKGKKYTWVDMLERQCKSATNGVHDLEWFKRNGAVTEQIRQLTKYEHYREMVARKLRYPIPYMEGVKKTGEELAQNLTRVGIDWWPTDSFVALPKYVPCVIEKTSPEYDFYLTQNRTPTSHTNADIPWMMEVQQHDLHMQGSILMNKGAARTKGIKDGDLIWVESEAGKVKGKVKLIEGIRPDTLLIPGMFGQWSTPMAKDTGRVCQSWLVPLRLDRIDPVVGSLQSQTQKVKVYKA